MYYRRDHTFDVKACFQQNRYVESGNVQIVYIMVSYIQSEE
jgi:hypothetical protein